MRHPTPEELQRMSWRARDRYQKRLKAEADAAKARTDAELAQADETDLPDTRAAVREMNEDDIRVLKRRYQAGIHTPETIAGHREYERRRKAKARAEGRAA